jgi:hypothetical protein
MVRSKIILEASLIMILVCCSLLSISVASDDSVQLSSASLGTLVDPADIHDGIKEEQGFKNMTRDAKIDYLIGTMKLDGQRVHELVNKFDSAYQTIDKNHINGVAFSKDYSKLLLTTIEELRKVFASYVSMKENDVIFVPTGSIAKGTARRESGDNDVDIIIVEDGLSQGRLVEIDNATEEFFKLMETIIKLQSSAEVVMYLNYNETPDEEAARRASNREERAELKNIMRAGDIYQYAIFKYPTREGAHKSIRNLATRFMWRKVLGDPVMAEYIDLIYRQEEAKKEIEENAFSKIQRRIDAENINKLAKNAPDHANALKKALLAYEHLVEYCLVEFDLIGEKKEQGMFYALEKVNDKLKERDISKDDSLVTGYGNLLELLQTDSGFAMPIIGLPEVISVAEVHKKLIQYVEEKERSIYEHEFYASA